MYTVLTCTYFGIKAFEVTFKICALIKRADKSLFTHDLKLMSSAATLNENLLVWILMRWHHWTWDEACKILVLNRSFWPILSF